jgi:hypothetical protein
MSNITLTVKSEDELPSVAEVIFQQIGGNHFRVMTGSKNFISYPDALVFAIPPNKSPARKVRITLTPRDTYRIEFFRTMQIDPIEPLTHEDVYFDQLQSVFTDVTGFYTWL